MELTSNTQPQETIVFDSLEVLANFCGPNNIHISVLEKFFNVSIFIVGNKIEILSQKDAARQDCKKICNYLITCICRSIAINSKFIQSAIYQMLGSTLYTANDNEGDTYTIDNEKSNINFLSNEHNVISTSSSDNKDDDIIMHHIDIPPTKKRIIARTRGQARVIQALQNYDLSFLVGPAGTGKTFLATAFALSLLLKKHVKRYIITRPVVEAGEQLGFLPGDLVQKTLPYLKPVYDALQEAGGDTVVQYLKDNEHIEIAPLAYMRGRTLHGSVVLLDEAQNCTMQQMKMFLTRIGENSKVIVTGDPSQSDLYSKNNGLKDALRIFNSVSEIAIVHLTEKDVQRSALAKIIVEAYKQFCIN